MSEWVITAGSAVVVLLMVGVATMLGFRASVRLDEAALARFAASEGDQSDATVIAANGKAAFARLRSGKLMVARAMGADISARVAAASALRVRLARGKLTVAFADLGFPPINMKLAEAPAWVAALATGDAA